jgi:hypothetical protein
MIFKPESFYESSLASTITAVQTTIPVTVAPNETAGFLVLEANTSNREIILYTGVTGTTLTGVTRGLAEYGSSVSAGTGKSHNAGTDIANRDVHYYYAQYYDFLTGVSATGANTMMIGDGGTCSASDRTWQVPLSSYTPFWGLSANGRMVVSEDGLTSYVISAGGSGIAAGDGIDITAGMLSVDLLSSAGLRISGGNLAIKPDFDMLKLTSASELYIDKTVSNDWTGANSFDGGVTFKDSCVFQSSGSYIFNGNMQTSALSCYQGMSVSGAFSVSSIYFAGGTDMQAAPNYSAGVCENISANTTTNTDITVTCNFQAKMIQLDYYIQGHDRAEGSAAYNSEKGVATFNSTTLASKQIYGTYSGASDNGAINVMSNTVNSTAAVAAGTDQATAGIMMTVTINSITSTGFVIRCASAKTDGGNTARANLAWKAWG